MTIKDTLDFIRKALRNIQYTDSLSKDREYLVSALENIIFIVGEALAQRDQLAETFNKYNNQLWINHVKGNLDCPHCKKDVPFSFYLGSKGLGGKAHTASSKENLIECLEFPPITKQDLINNPIPDFMPDL